MLVSQIRQPKPVIPERRGPVPFGIHNLTENTLEVKMGDDTLYKWNPESSCAVQPHHWATSRALERLVHEGVLMQASETNDPEYRTRRLGQYACDHWRQCRSIITDCILSDNYRFPFPKDEADLHPLSKARFETCPNAKKGLPVTRRLADRNEREVEERAANEAAQGRENQLRNLVAEVEQMPGFGGWKRTEDGRYTFASNDVLAVNPRVVESFMGRRPEIERYLAERKAL